MGRLEQLMDMTFCKGGRLEQLAKAGIISPFVARSGQHQYAMELARSIESPVLATPMRRLSADQIASRQKRAPVMVAQVGTGIGKTIPNVVLGGFIRNYCDDRMILCTYTRALRDEMSHPDMQVLVNAVMASFNMPPVSIGSVRSSCTIADLSYAKKVATEVATHGQSQYTQDARDFVAAIETAERNGDVFHLNDWLEQGRSFDFFTLGRGGTNADKIVSNLAVTLPRFQHLAKTNAAFKQFHLTNVAAKNSDIVIATHTLFVYNGRNLGTVLKTNTRQMGKYSPPTEDTFHVLIDEADQFAHQSTTTFDTHFSLASVDEVFIGTNGKRSAAVGALRKALDRMNIVTNSAKVLSTEIEQRKIIEPIRKVIGALSDEFANGKHAGEIVYDYAQRLLTSLMAVHDWYAERGVNTFDARAIDDAGINLAIRKVAVDGGFDYNFIFEALTPRKVINRTWRNFNSHAIKSFTFLSGTLLDGQDDAEQFCRLVGIGQTDAKHARNINIRTTGRADRIVFAHGPADVWESTDLETVHSENHQKSRVISAAFFEHVVSAIKYTTQDAPCLILLNSYRDLELLEAAFPNRPDFVFQKRGERSSDFVDRLLNHPMPATAFSLFWSGVNFTQNGRTMFKRLVIPRLPFKPFKETGNYTTESPRLRMEAFWQLRQGFGRLFRSPGDVHGDIWILDPRLRPDPDICDILEYRGGHREIPHLFDQIIKDSTDGLGSTKFALWSGGKITKEEEDHVCVY